MIFGSVINEDLKDEIVVTVIATGFSESTLQQTKQFRPGFGQMKQQTQQQQQQPQPQQNQPYPTSPQRRDYRNEEPSHHEAPPAQPSQPVEDTLDIPTFLRNRNRRR